MNALNGKTVVFLGSSVTYGVSPGGFGIPELLAEATGCISVKEAVSGTTLANLSDDSYVARFDRIPRETKADLFVCQLSTNDATQRLPLGEISDTPDDRTVIGAMETIIRRAKAQWGCPIVFYVNPKFDSQPYAEMVKALYRLKEKHGLHVIDLWNDKSFDNVPEAWVVDAIHPSLEGYRLGWLPVFRSELEKIVK